jgi:uncharacterized protein YlxW (UPF0749 family)
VTARELRLRQRIDQLTDQRDDLAAELAEVKADIQSARIAAGKSDDGAHAWLAEYDRRKEARRAKRRRPVAV